jgi:hypothetical protein
VPSTPSPCEFLTGKMRTACENAQKTVPGNDGSGSSDGSQAGGSGGLFSGPGSDWWRHAAFRLVEVVVGIAMVVAAVKAFTSSSDTVKVISQGVKKVAKA